MEYEKLFELVVADIPIKQENPCFGLTFIAAPGVGKSTVSKLIAEKTGLYITANDKIRRLFDSLNIDPVENRKLVEQLANDRTVYMLKNKTSMIIDANMRFFWKNAKENFNNHNAKLFFIKLDCPEDVILQRIDSRAANFEKDTTNYSRAVRDDYYKYIEKCANNEFDESIISYTINTNDSLDGISSQIDQMLTHLKTELKK